MGLMTGTGGTARATGTASTTGVMGGKETGAPSTSCSNLEVRKPIVYITLVNDENVSRTACEQSFQ